ncbi:hypothetical protein C8J57DRAFT_1590134, partial [Mycena rebaudengoi]
VQRAAPRALIHAHPPGVRQDRRIRRHLVRLAPLPAERPPPSVRVVRGVHSADCAQYMMYALLDGEQSLFLRGPSGDIVSSHVFKFNSQGLKLEFDMTAPTAHQAVACSVGVLSVQMKGYGGSDVGVKALMEFTERIVAGYHLLLTIMSSAREIFLDAGRSIGMQHAALSKRGAARDNSTAGKIFSQSIVPDRNPHL